MYLWVLKYTLHIAALISGVYEFLQILSTFRPLTSHISIAIYYQVSLNHIQKKERAPDQKHDLHNTSGAINTDSARALLEASNKTLG